MFQPVYGIFYVNLKKLQNLLKEKDTDILGEWIGRYPGDGFQTINISMVEHQYIATKITGDEYVPAGEITFLLDKNFEILYELIKICFKYKLINEKSNNIL